MGELDEKIAVFTHNIPNIPHKSVPIGKDEKANEVIKEWGDIKKFTFTPQNHLNICGKLGLADFSRAARIIGMITTSGGGMLVSDDLKAWEKMRFWSTQAKDPALHYQHSEMGYNYRMSNLLAAVGRGQLRVLDERVRRKREIFDYYQKALGDLCGIEFMPEASYGRSNRWLTVLTVDSKRCGVTSNEIINALEEENIEARPVWKPLHVQPLFNCFTKRRKNEKAQKKCAYYPHRISESVCDGLFEKGLCLPSGTAMTKEDIDRIVEVIRA